MCLGDTCSEKCCRCFEVELKPIPYHGYLLVTIGVANNRLLLVTTSARNILHQQAAANIALCMFRRC
jgi:hypothetical protein